MSALSSHLSSGIYIPGNRIPNAEILTSKYPARPNFGRVKFPYLRQCFLKTRVGQEHPFQKTAATSPEIHIERQSDTVSVLSHGFSMPVSKKQLLTITVALSILIIAPLFPQAAMALSSATDSLAASSLGQKIATALRTSGVQDEIIVFLLAMLPVLELRGAIPVAYWMALDPWKASILAVAGNILPVPVILLCLGPLYTFATKSSDFLKDILEWVLETTRKKSGPIQEFKWLGLMLFVAVPLPGTGAWSGAIAAHLLGMQFWSALSANLVGVMLAGFIVNQLCRLGFKSALLLGIALFITSTIVWTLLRWIQGPKQTQ